MTTPQAAADSKPAPSQELRDLAKSIEHLASSIDDFNKIVNNMQQEDPKWKTLPEILTNLNREIRTLASRL